MDKATFEQAKKIENNAELARGMADSIEGYINSNTDESFKITIGKREFYLHRAEPLDKIILDGILNGLYQAKEKYSQMFAEL